MRLHSGGKFFIGFTFGHEVTRVFDLIQGKPRKLRAVSSLITQQLATTILGTDFLIFEANTLSVVLSDPAYPIYKSKKFLTKFLSFLLSLRYSSIFLYFIKNGM